MTKIFLDSGDPAETREVLKFFPKLAGQTTNPSLITKNPEAQERLAKGNKFSQTEILTFYQKVIQEISALILKGSVSVEVYADANSRAEDLIKQAQEMNSWIPNAHIKLPITKAGLEAAHILTKQGVRLNMTLCFNQEQAAAVHAATLGAKKGDIFVSPFIGRLDDRGEKGMDLIKNILEMYKKNNSHVEVLSASIRDLEHMEDALGLGSDLITAPLKAIEDWIQAGKPERKKAYDCDHPGFACITYEELNLSQDWENFNIQHNLTDIGLKKFVDDWKKMIK